MVVLDTDFLIDAMRGDEDAGAKLRELVDGFRPIGVSTISVMQLHHGVVRSEQPERERARIRRALRGATVRILDHDVAARAGELDGMLAAAGDRIGIADTIIVATALHHGEPVLTRNHKHFERVAGLEVERY